MFNQNKYTKLYYRIVDNAKCQKRNKRRSTHRNYIYYEEHHIIPKSLQGTNFSDNLVLLTAREHFLCHYLLCKMVDYDSARWHKLVRAFTFMYSSSAKQCRYVNSRLYASARKNMGHVMSQSQSGKGNSQFGTIWIYNFLTEHTCKISKDELPRYIKLGYTVGRITDWGQYHAQIQNEIIKHNNKIQSKIKHANNKIELLTQEIQNLDSKFVCL
jgi:hypothetical protein